MPLESTQPMYKDGQANASQASSSTKDASASVQNKSQVSASAPREMKDGENSVLKKEEEGRLIAKARDENGDKEGDSDSDSDSDEEPTWSGGNPRAPMRPPYSGTRPPTKPPGGIRR